VQNYQKSMKNTKKHKRVVQLQTNVMRKHGLKQAKYAVYNMHLLAHDSIYKIKQGNICNILEH
jgi:hypothetical protein